MGYRIQLLSLFGVSDAEMQSKIMDCCPGMDSDFFADSTVYSSNAHCTTLAVSSRAEISKHLADLAAIGPSVRIVTNETDDWHIKIQKKSAVLVDLHLPLVNVNSDEWQEPDGIEVREGISCELPEAVSNQIEEIDSAEAWRIYFEYAKQSIEKSLTACKIPFDASKLSQLFSEDSWEEVADTVGAQLGFFVNGVIETGLDLSPADD